MDNASVHRAVITQKYMQNEGLNTINETKVDLCYYYMIK